MYSIGKKALILVLGFSCQTTAFQSSSFGFTQSTAATSAFALQAKNSITDENLSFENAVRNGWKPERGQFAGIRRKTHTSREMSNDGAVMPDGGLSPCIIKVVGVGGGGCNAVS